MGCVLTHKTLYFPGHMATSEGLAQAVAELSTFTSAMDVGRYLSKHSESLVELSERIRSEKTSAFWATWLLRDLLGGFTFNAVGYDIATRPETRGAMRTLFFGSAPPEAFPYVAQRETSGDLWSVASLLCMFRDSIFPTDPKREGRRDRLMSLATTLRHAGDEDFLRDSIVSEYGKPLHEVGEEARQRMGVLVFKCIEPIFPNLPPPGDDVPRAPCTSTPFIEPVHTMDSPGPQSALAAQYARVCP